MIGKLRKGEKVIVLRVAEPLQEKYDKLQKETEEMKWMADEMKKLSDMNVQIPDEKLSAIARKHSGCDILRMEFWKDVNDQYNLWHVPNIGIRDGYCIVVCREMPKPEDVMKRLRSVLDEEFGGIFGIAGPDDER